MIVIIYSNSNLIYKYSGTYGNETYLYLVLNGKFISLRERDTIKDSALAKNFFFV